MTQETDEQISQKYSRVSSRNFPTYHQARTEAENVFSSAGGVIEFGQEMTNEKTKVRIKLRSKNGRESFDVIAYERITSKD